ncbi:ABC transporter permease [Futiania mangrovi]|uniref:ABC transporter permease n=1 Tax=Futiania mangrovi TaxID=2959716 RepID=A0A9J6PCN0_9PROT|nr:ABC transporter permease [Futiania mangrovii]MCP1336030.1 ABC transporter permease [Futiania mangrovii]
MIRGAVTAAGLLALWWLVTVATAVPAYILPGPDRVLAALWTHRAVLAENAGVTLLEIVLGLALGLALGVGAALGMAMSARAERWVKPVIVISQALPVFALAPILVLWLGFGLASKVAMAALIIFFPVAAAFHDGLARTEPGWIDLARTLRARPGARVRAGDLRILWHIRMPAALPALASGARVAAAVAPIGAVVGEWVGSSAGLGRLMLHANARLQVDLMFAALLVLAVMALAVWALVDTSFRRLVRWNATDS